MADQQDFKNALSRWASGVSIVTTRSGNGEPAGFTASSFTSVSLDPPLVLFCLDNQAASLPAFEKAAGFAVNILAREQEALSNRFASRSSDNKFDGVEYEAGLLGSPVLKGSLAVLQCRLHDRVPAGDHLILIGRVESVSTEDHPPLLYYRGGDHSL